MRFIRNDMYCKFFSKTSKSKTRFFNPNGRDTSADTSNTGLPQATIDFASRRMVLVRKDHDAEFESLLRAADANPTSKNIQNLLNFLKLHKGYINKVDNKIDRNPLEVASKSSNTDAIKELYKLDARVRNPEAALKIEEIVNPARVRRLGF